MFSPICIATFLILAALTTLSIHPLTIARLLIIFSLVAALFSFKLLNSWFFYMLTLVFLGGVIVVLSFIVSLCGNEQFSFPPISIFSLWPLICLPLRIINNSSSQITEYSDNQIILALYQNDRRWCFSIIIVVLIICIIRAVRLRKIERGPLVKRL